MKISWFWRTLFIILLAALYFMAFLHNKSSAKSLEMQQYLELSRKTLDSLEHAFISKHNVMFKHFGRKLDLSNAIPFYTPTPEEAGPALPEKHPYLLLVFSELSCNVCQDEESAFGNEVALALGPAFVRAVIHGNREKYVRDYLRLNRVEYTVFFDKNKQFMENNDIEATPLVLLVNENDEILFAHYPIPGHSNVSEPFHNYVREYFGI